MTRIIGHRGAAGLALENSKSSFRTALKLGVDMVELDVRLTADGQLVVCHDKQTRRIAAINLNTHTHTLAELQKITLRNGERLLSLDEALDIIGNVPVFIDIKDKGVVDALTNTLKQHPEAQPTFGSYHQLELAKISQRFPDRPTFVLEHFSPIEIIHSARRLKATGIDLNMWLMNPLTYQLAKRYHLELYLYTVNHPFIAWFLKTLYPGISIFTDHPERFIKKSGKPYEASDRNSHK